MNKIVVAGFGFVGKTVYHFISDSVKEKTHVYDIHNVNEKDPVFDSKFIFVCLPTPTIKGKQDLTIITDFLQNLEYNKYSGIVIIKSTVVIDLSLRFPKLSIVYNPEFLRQASPIDDFKNQRVHILGGEYDKTVLVQEMYETCFNIEKCEFRHVSIKTAILTKYINNIYKAYKVLFWNYVHDLPGNVMDTTVSELVSLLGDVGALGDGTAKGEQAIMHLDGLAGFGGACFPKDVVAFHGNMFDNLTKFMIDYNHGYRSDEMDKVLK